MSYAEQLRGLGFQAPEELAVGMQGAVYRLGAGKVAKIWFHAQERELRMLGELYDALHGRLPYATPRILELHRPGPYWVTVEDELPGVPLHTVAAPYGEPGWERARDCVVEVVEALAQVEAPEVLRRTAVLDETDPFRPEGMAWSEALTGLLRRRVERFGDQLAPVIDDFGTKIATLLELLGELKEPDARLVHGDVTSGNILVDEDLRPVTLLDFGLSTMAGDPVFEAAAARERHRPVVAQGPRDRGGVRRGVHRQARVRRRTAARLPLRVLADHRERAQRRPVRPRQPRPADREVLQHTRGHGVAVSMTQNTVPSGAFSTTKSASGG
ncbi:aminoglycoside phosphotransferase (APT) family kinase protein [Kribbella aluminosa]|uniref:Aminoglycoside phosphotransferase (APT) family kinase protein n=1 Tax=Kribbella aluminosa TaxID=416017 RepID=A0ABS4UEZ7_9ACTN|nr:phosphotransferase [Kribbella aluminosa]MBP2350141.1 aminoglycoside phosphotransferase (APT) family kinase protein [Kribbella aluminosa]